MIRATVWLWNIIVLDSYLSALPHIEKAFLLAPWIAFARCLCSPLNSRFKLGRDVLKSNTIFITGRSKSIVWGSHSLFVRCSTRWFSMQAFCLKRGDTIDSLVLRQVLTLGIQTFFILPGSWIYHWSAVRNILSSPRWLRNLIAAFLYRHKIELDHGRELTFLGFVSLLDTVKHLPMDLIPNVTVHDLAIIRLRWWTSSHL